MADFCADNTQQVEFDEKVVCGLWQCEALRASQKGSTMMMSSNGNIFRITGPLWLVNSPHKGQWRGSLMFSLSCAWINVWINNHEAGDLRCHHAHYDITVMTMYMEKGGIAVLGKNPYVSHFLLAVIGYGIYKWYAFHSSIHSFNWHIQLLKEAVHIGFQSLHLECYINFKIGLYDTVLC